MAIALRGTPSVSSSPANPTTTFDISIPAATQAGDLLVLAFTSRNHTSGDAQPTVTDNDDLGNVWTQINFSGADRKAQLWAKVATGSSAGATVTVAGCINSSAGVLKAFSGVLADTVTNIFDGQAAFESNASGDETNAGFTPSEADCMVLAFVWNYGNDNAVTSLSFATLGATTMTEDLSSGGTDCAVAFGHALQTGGPAATGDLTWAQTNGTTYSFAKAIRPASTATSLTPSPVVAATSIPVPSLSHQLGITPSPVAAPTSIPAPTVQSVYTLSPDPVVAATALPAPTLGMGPVTMTPDPVAAASSVPAPSVTLVYSLTPSPIVAATDVPSVSVAHVLTLAPDPVVAVTSTVAPSVTHLYTVAPSPVAAVTSVPAVAIDQPGAPITLSPDPVVATTSVAAPSVSHVLTLTPDAVTVQTSVVAVVVGGEQPAPVQPGGGGWWPTSEDREKEKLRRRRRVRGSLLVMRFFHE